MDKKVIAPDEWNEYLADFSSRNQGRRARFEAFSHDGVAEEDEEAVFESVAMSCAAPLPFPSASYQSCPLPVL